MLKEESSSSNALTLSGVLYMNPLPSPGMLGFLDRAISLSAILIKI